MCMRCVRSVTGLSASIAATLSGVVALSLLGTGSALAIPSPELIVGSFVSLSQLFALASAILGGGAAYATVRARRGGSQSLSRSMIVAAVVMFVLLVVSVGFNIYQYVEQKNERQLGLKARCCGRPAPRQVSRTIRTPRS